jgi:hypothetical protein
MKPRKKAVWEWKIIRRAVWDALLKLDPRKMMGNPVMFVVEIGSVITTVLLFKGGTAFKFNLQITLWLWFTVLFANFAEAMAEGRGKAQADTLRKARSETMASRLTGSNGHVEQVKSSDLRAGDLVFVSAGENVPSDGEIIEGVASVDESAITGESAPVIREAGGDRSAVTGGTRVLSDKIKVKITSNPGETFLDRMIALVEGAERQKTPNEIALNILLSGLTIIFLLAVVTLQPFAIYSGSPQTLFVLVSLLVCLIPTTIGGLLSAIGIAGCRDGQWRRPVTSTLCYSIKRALLPWEIVRHRSSSLRQVSLTKSLPTLHNSLRLLMRLRRAVQSWSLPRKSTACGAENLRRTRPILCLSPPRRVCPESTSMDLRSVKVPRMQFGRTCSNTVAKYQPKSTP